MTRFTSSTLLAIVAACAAFPVRADPEPLQNVLQLSAQGAVEVQQDLLSITLGTSRDGADALSVQNQLKAALQAALAEAQRGAQPGQMDVRTGNFSLSSRYQQGGRINGWQGSAELVLQGKDFARISETASRITTLTVRGTGFGLSREERTRVEGQAQAEAVAAFKARAAELSRQFGFGSYTLREVSVNSSEGANVPRMRMMPMAAEASAPIPVEAGKASVTVTVSGSVQLR